MKKTPLKRKGLKRTRLFLETRKQQKANRRKYAAISNFSDEEFLKELTRRNFNNLPGSSMLKRHPIRKVSKKRSAELRRYAKLRDKFLSDQPWCEIGESDCTRKAVDVHHIKGRNGKLLNELRWFAATCRSCHRYVHDHPAWGRKHHWIQT